MIGEEGAVSFFFFFSFSGVLIMGSGKRKGAIMIPYWILDFYGLRDLAFLFLFVGRVGTGWLIFFIIVCNIFFWLLTRSQGGGGDCEYKRHAEKWLSETQQDTSYFLVVNFFIFLKKVPFNHIHTNQRGHKGHDGLSLFPKQLFFFLYFFCNPF